ncbi:TolC family protein [Parabacteroides sp. AM08-6]|uniref:TolC family protein n=1 Tax=Parabacteroides sp. AM08-6 TaxID=2292053 RepID=UPI003519F1A4
MVPFIGFTQEEVRGQKNVVTLDDAIEMALQNHPRLKMAIASVERSRALRGEAFELSSTSFNYSWGQINGEARNDNQMELTQSFGSLLTPFYKNALISRQVKTGQYYQEMVKKEIIAEVKRAWAYYQYAFHLRALYCEQNDLAERLRKAGELRYEQGDITLLERNMTITLATELHTQLIQAEEEYTLATRRFVWACYADYPIIPADTSLRLFPIDTNIRSSSEIWHNYFQSQADEKKVMLLVERSRFFPELSLGYVRQKIAPANGLNSWMVGVSFPILFFPQKSRVKQAKLDAYITRMNADATIRETDNKVEELQVTLRKHSESIQYYITSALQEAEALKESALIQFRESETDITQFVQSLNVVLGIRRSYIETVYNYNIAALELEMYTQ